MAIVRPYKVYHEENKIKRLIIAVSPSQAIRHVSSGWKAEPASALEAVLMMSEEGIESEDATGGAPKEDEGADGDEAESGAAGGGTITGTIVADAASVRTPAAADA